MADAKRELNDKEMARKNLVQEGEQLKEQLDQKEEEIVNGLRQAGSLRSSLAEVETKLRFFTEKTYVEA